MFLLKLKLLLITAGLLCFVNGLELEEYFQWNELTFAWPDEATEKAAIDSKEYIPEHNFPLGLARWKDKLFVTLPRWRPGVVATLNYIPLNDKTPKSPALIPYPDWEANKLPLNGTPPVEGQLVSIFRLYPDQCDRLWVMETGVANILGDAKQVIPPTIVVYDLMTDKVLKRYELKNSDIKPESFFPNIVVDVTQDNCDQAFAYIPDLGGFGLVVYSWEENDSWRVKHNYFYFDPLQGNFNIEGFNFQWTDGVFGVALSPPVTGNENSTDAQNEDESDIGYRRLYFHALASTTQFSVSTRVLRNRTLSMEPDSYNLYKVEGNKGDLTQASGLAYDNVTDVLFMTQLNRNGVACWNTKKELKPSNVALVAEDPVKLIFPNDLKLDCERNVWVLSDRLPKFFFKELDKNEVNYRIFKIPVDTLIKGTVCEP